jgi:hypothetical protein
MAYSEGPEGIALRADFCRWLARKAHKGGNMIQTDRQIKGDTVILIFEGVLNDEGKSVEQIVAETIVKISRAHPGEGISSWQIHFCSYHHPFSATQRLRFELKRAFERWWLDKYMADTIGEISLDDQAYWWDKKQCRFFFSPHFIDFLEKIYLPALTQKTAQEPDHVPAD